jgi:hypothetical protein
MKRLLIIFFFVTVFYLSAASAFAQNIIYLDVDYKPATAANYFYKRAIKHKEPVMNLNLGTDIYGGVTSNAQPSGLHICSLTDYYKTGEPALVVNVKTNNPNCSGGYFDGAAVYYFKNGGFKRKEFWKFGKLEGAVVYYDEEGKEAKREEYVNGKLIEEGKVSAPADSPVIGTWKHVEYYDFNNSGQEIGGIKIPPSVKEELTITFSNNGVYSSVSRNSISSAPSKFNWKYSAKTGIYELFLGHEMLARCSVKWIDADTFEDTILFSNEPSYIGIKRIFRRVGK